MRRYKPGRTFTEKRDMLIAVAAFAAVILVVIQPLVMPWVGVRITARWGLVIQAIGVACLVIGLLLVRWARLHLRNLFSEQVELQPGHYVVNTGPYALVRHPLYTTYVLMVFGQLLIKPAIIELLLLCFVIWHFSRLARVEEALLSEKLPGYKEYMTITPRFVPTFWHVRIGQYF